MNVDAPSPILLSPSAYNAPSRDHARAVRPRTLTPTRRRVKHLFRQSCEYHNTSTHIVDGNCHDFAVYCFGNSSQRGEQMCWAGVVTGQCRKTGGSVSIIARSGESMPLVCGIARLFRHEGRKVSQQCFCKPRIVAWNFCLGN